ncbi:hypothetical protein D7X74_24025 [Corallococcus sp. CA047B]|uniref:type VI secretion system baseplate subunit TssG n=1 Tax=Corallococcus sp. CA047B TaxID=2316729 RepID=UPI000EA18632|nr:type VI secretion system baseplate subunit TssG [Corallococcus sp. CA047B]RKH12222.1 hypothetical protein D7X74_24025 [Corallococcus sp. CA047B]
MNGASPLLSPLERRIRARAKDFDLGPLLRLLESQGYVRDRVLFESNPEPVASASLVEAVTFHASPVRRVVVTLNLGLLGTPGLLPSYFLQVAEQLPEPEPFLDFIRFFDHRLLLALVEALHPERNVSLVGDWERTKGFYQRMVGVDSQATLQWLFQQVFPELRVTCCRRSFRTRFSGMRPTFGPTPLDGTGILGNTYAADIGGFQVELLADEESDMRGRDWPSLVRHRFHRHVLPLLVPARLRLEVVLTVRAHGRTVRLGPRPRGQLGYERLPGAEGKPLRQLIYLGDTAVPVAAPPRPDVERQGMNMGTPKSLGR